MTETLEPIRGQFGLRPLTAATGLPVTSLGELPAPVAPKFSLLSEATIVNDPEVHWLAGKTLRGYPEPNLAPWSPEVDTVKPDPATFRHLVTTGFAVAGRWQCDTGGIVSPEEFSTRAQQSFLAWETVAVEKQLWTNVLGLAPFVGLDQEDTTAYAGDTLTILNGGTAVKPIVGLSLLEDYIGRRPFAGVVHATPGFAAMLGFLNVQPQGGYLRTLMGTTIVSGVGYPGTGKDGASAAGLTEWVFGTGPVECRRSEMIVFDNMNQDQNVMDRDLNNWTVTIERYYLVDFDPLIHVAVLIDKAA